MVVVARQSVSILGTLIAPYYQARLGLLLFFGLLMYLLGCVQYVLITSLILYRIVFFPLTPKEFSPTYWINMGAAAITTLAGSTLILIPSTLRCWPGSSFLLD